jgi:DNA-binding NarL/FixJ family response regulator
MIRVLIVDDHAVVAEGLRHVVDAQQDMRVIDCLQDSRAAVRCALEVRPNVVIMDHAMPDLNGTEATRLIRSRCPEVQVVMLSMHTNQVHVMHALQAGARGYVAKKSAAKEVVDAIRAVYHGGRFLSQGLADKVIDQALRKPAAKDHFEQLSSRERQVLQMLAEGHTTAKVATLLSLSPKTVETYRSRMMQKLQIQDFATLVRFAIQSGIAPLDEI